MRLIELDLRNIQQFSALRLKLSAAQSDFPVTLILGDQGAGKSTLLKHAFQALSWFPALHKEPRSNGLMPAENDIRQNAGQAVLAVQVSYPAELGFLADDSGANPEQFYQCRWQISKICTESSRIFLNRNDIAQLEQLAQRYQQQTRQDPHFSTPCIAFYPAERFVHEVNLNNKNANSTLTPMHNAYDQSHFTFNTFVKFFDWLREVHDQESAKAAQLLREYMDPQTRFSSQMAFDEIFAKLEQTYRQSVHRCLGSLRRAVHTVLPEIEDIYLQVDPKLTLMVKYQGQTLPYMQLSSAHRTWIAIVGDIVRRLCLLNPHSFHPCLDGEGIVFIDEFDAQLDDNHRYDILSRLHQAFPQLQWLVSSSTTDWANLSQPVECYRLQQQRLIAVDWQAHRQQLQQIYQDLQHSDNPPLQEQQTVEPIPLTIGQILFDIRQLSDDDQLRLLNYLKKRYSHPCSDDDNRL